MMWNLLKHIKKERSNTIINYKICNDNCNLRCMRYNTKSWEIHSSNPIKVYQTYFNKIPTIINQIPTLSIYYHIISVICGKHLWRFLQCFLDQL